jgi:hypothetical protein
MATKKKSSVAHERRSGNVFADLGLASPEQEQLKTRLTLQIYRIIKTRKIDPGAGRGRSSALPSRRYRS